MREARRGIRLRTLLIAVAICAAACGVGVHLYRAFDPVPRWIRESRPGNPQFTRRQAVFKLGYRVPASGVETAYPALLAAAQDADPSIRMAAVSALSRRGDHFAEVFPILLGLMKDPAPSVREAAIFFLERFVTRGSPQVSTLIPELIAALDDPRPAVRLEAVRALYILGQLPRAVPAMARLVREEKGTYRLGALGFLMLSKTIPKDMEPTLRAMLESENIYEGDVARQALIRMGIPETERDAMIRTMAESPDHARRLAAAGLLLEVGQPGRAIPILREVAARGGTDERARAERMLDEQARAADGGTP